jgi:hypothetical protein
MSVSAAGSKSTPSTPSSSKAESSSKSQPSSKAQPASKSSSNSAPSSSAPSKPATSSATSRMDAPSKPKPVDLSGAPAKPGLKPANSADTAQVQKLGAGDQIKLKTSAGAKAGETNAQAESSVAVKKNDAGKYEVSADRSTAVGAGLHVPPEPSRPGSPSAATSPATPERPGLPRGPITDTSPKPQEQGRPGGITLPRPGGIVSVPGGPSILTQPGVTTQPGNKPTPGTGPLGEGPLLGHTTQPPAPSAEDKGPDVEVGAKTGSTVTYTVQTPQEAARAAEILRGGTVASPDEAAALNGSLSSQEVRYASTAKASGNGLTAEEAGTTAFKENYENGQVSGTELKSEFEVTGEGKLHGVGLQAGDKVSFTAINKGGTTSYESAAELSGVAKAPGDGFLTGSAGAKTEYKFSPQGTEVSSFVTSQQGVNAQLGPASVGATVELEDRVYHAVNGVADA